MLLSQMEPSGEIGLSNGCSIPLSNPKSAMAWALETFRLWKGKVHPRIQDTTYESVSLSTNTLVSARRELFSASRVGCMEVLVWLGLIDVYLRNFGSQGPVPASILEDLVKTNHGIAKGSLF